MFDMALRLAKFFDITLEFLIRIRLGKSVGGHEGRGRYVPIEDHPSFRRPAVSTRLWRYTDLPKFLDLLTSRRLWLTNAEILAQDDPYEGLPGAVQFPHRLWRCIEEVPEALRTQIIQIYGRTEGATPESAFNAWYMLEEQSCIFTRSGRRDFFINCWHAAEHESVAMWKIYSSPGAGVAIISNGARLGSALEMNLHKIYLGYIEYVDNNIFQIGTNNTFDSLMIKRENYQYEREVRLVHWNTENIHDPLVNFKWNISTRRFDDLVDDNRPLIPGLALDSDLDTLIERVIVSPFAPAWYLPMIERLRDKLGLKFPVNESKLLVAPRTIP